MSSVKGATGPIGSNVLVSVPSTPMTGQVFTYGVSGSSYDAYEPYIETTIKALLYEKHKFGDAGLRNYLLGYIKQYKVFTKLREAVIDVCPDQVALLDKLIPLK